MTRLTYTPKVGMRVVCVDASDVRVLVEGNVYTISGLSVSDDILWVEIAGIFEPDGRPGGWFPWRFHPLEEHQPDIEIFRDILRKVETGRPLETEEA